MDEQQVLIEYTNWRGERAYRKIFPKRLFWGGTEWHPEPQWLLEAEDVEKKALRIFSVRDIHSWASCN